MIGDDVSLVGYVTEWIGEGTNLTADITLYLRCERETDEWWKVFIHGETAALPGRRAISDHAAVGDRYPSVAWQPGQILVDHTRIRMGWILDAVGGQGELTVMAGLFHDMTRARVDPESAGDAENRVVVGRFSTTASPAESVIDELPASVEALEVPVRLGPHATLLAHEVHLRGRGRRALAEVTLYLRADSRSEEPWQVFVHVEGRDGGRQVDDHHPGAGKLRTTAWQPRKIAVDRSIIDLSAWGPEPSSVEVLVGLFHRNDRAPVEPSSAHDGDNRATLGRYGLDEE